MLLRTISIAVVAVGFSAGQDHPAAPEQEIKKIPLLQIQTDRWLRGEFDQTQRKRNFIVTPELKVTPQTRAENFNGKCSIPLLELKPDVDARIKVLPAPKGEGHIRIVKPPAPPCAPAEGESVSRAPKPEADSAPQPK
jgi:hypothetical protein